MGRTSFFERPDATGLVPDRGDGTHARYAAVAHTVARNAKRDLGHPPTLTELATWLTGQNGRYKHSTIRQYRAAIREVMDRRLEAGKLSLEKAQQIDLILKRKPVFTKRRRTSGRKRTSATPEEIDAVLDRLSRSKVRFKVFASLYIVYGITYFLRPVEWSRARIENDNLVIGSAKTTNGRGTGKERTILLLNEDGHELVKLDCFLAELQIYVAERGWPSVARKLAKTIAAACRAAKIPPLAPYTLRHIGIATAKLRFSVQFVAALAGQASDRTASTSYAKARSGLPDWPQQIEPAPATLALVRVTGKDRRPTRPEETSTFSR